MLSPPCVLIVEDSYVVLEMLRLICGQSGIRVLEASSGEAALTILRKSGVEIDWLLTDIALPGLIDGWDVAEAFRAAHADRPVVYASVAPPAGGRPVPKSLFVRKPFQIHEMRGIATAMNAAAAERRRIAA
ncbi:response regulator [Methylobacterium sp. sgz302541]|uniref:response regulator n=1 Tax=unclassified Methylobacterium TaxID=2615210 RepID=UPI003D34C9F7